MAELALQELEQRFGHRPQLLVHSNLNPNAADVPKAEIARLSADDLLLVLDDVSNTGNRLRRFQLSLRELRYQGRICYAVGVARPETDEQWTRRERDLKFRSARRHEAHIVRYVEKVNLPNWNERECPWCHELQILSTLYRGRKQHLGTAASEVLRRIIELQEAMAGDGLIYNAIWQIPGAGRPVLTENSIFLDYRNATDADLLGSIAAALQQMRARSRDRLTIAYPHATVIDPADYFDTFNDAVIGLGILRVATRSELERWTDDLESRRRERVRRKILESDGDRSHAMRLEYAVDILARKIPVPSLSDGDWDMLQGESYAGVLRYALKQ